MVVEDRIEGEVFSEPTIVENAHPAREGVAPAVIRETEIDSGCSISSL
jgi:hypothetical protein